MPARRRTPPAQGVKACLGAAAAVGIVLLPLAATWWPLAILVPAAIVGLSSIDWRRQRRIAEARKGESICQFARGFDCRTIDTWLIRAVYEEFVWSFPLRPSDRLKEDLRIDGDDLDFGAINIARRAGRCLDGYERNPMYGKIKTLRDVVMFFQHQPLLSAPQARQQR
jgi:hypothetical protein